MDAPIHYRRLRAPRQQGEKLIDPPFNVATDLLSHSGSSTVQPDIGGKSLGSLRMLARGELLSTAREYSSRYRDRLPAEPDPKQPIVLAGHQPELFHPGVWFKNLVLHELARRNHATAVNLVIDNDTIAVPAIRVPTGSLANPRVESVTFDKPADVNPYEDREIVDAAHFASFADRVKQAAGQMLPQKIILDDLWPRAIELSRGGMKLGAAIAAARHRYEQDWGLETLEVPLSLVCSGEAFRRFLLHLMLHAEEFRRIYNDALVEYRQVHGIRSRSHPAPDLEEVDGFLESPFWIWSQTSPRREHLYVRQTESVFQLSDLNSSGLRFDLATSGSMDRAVESFSACEQHGIRIRPRALITTMFARLFLGDMFIHGIGGAKYDQLTDAIISRFFGIEPPAYMTATATVYPPYDLPSVEPSDVTLLKHRLRELEYHPELHVDLERHPEAGPLVEAKQNVIAAAGEHLSNNQHQTIVAANGSLQGFLTDQRNALRQERLHLENELKRKRLLHSREFSFCLFSDDDLRQHLTIAESV